MAPFPLAKLAYMAIKQISKPVAGYIKRKARTTPFLRNYILLPPAQLYHYLDLNVRMRLLGLGKVKDVKPLNEEVAIDLAADMLGETFIFSIGLSYLYYEYRRQAKKDQNKEDFQNERLCELEACVKDMGLLVESQNAQLREVTRLLAAAPNVETVVPRKIIDQTSGPVLMVQPR